jgi:hypothetical protein
LNCSVEEQTLKQRLVADSALPRLELDISDNDIPHAVEQIADWMEQTSALYLD